MITIIDYGMGNLGSVLSMFKRLGVESEITNDLKKIEDATKILLPGVGAFDTAMERINSTGLRAVLDKKALIDKVPILGICLGMQLLTSSSEEGHIPGLNWIPAKSLRFKFDENSKLKVPHMGWNVVKEVNPSKLTLDFDSAFRFYFVHSYYVKCDSRSNAILTTNHGLDFDSAIQSGNIYGTQFHPEKSLRYGMKLFKNFSEI